MGKEYDKLTEEDIKLQFITPALENAGWDKRQGMLRMEYGITDGKVIVQGQQHSRKSPLKADYLLLDEGHKPIAVVEAKDGKHDAGFGLQQAINYAELMDLKFAYSSNGEAFVEHDFTTGREKRLVLSDFPAPQALRQRLAAHLQYTDEQKRIVDFPYFSDGSGRSPRYYQRVAIDRTVEAVATGQNRILLVMATGTGKTYTAFQIVWRLVKSGCKRKVLYVADRNVLIDQTMGQDFKPFRKEMTKVTGKKMDSSYEIYMALYQQLVSTDPATPDPFTAFAPTFFDLIVVDECHRGSAKEDSQWRKVLSYFSSATQIGMTATPKSVEGADNLEYFGNPLYTYSLKQGIEDGFLAPYRVTRSLLNIDLKGWEPKDNEVDLRGQLIDAGVYSRNDFDRRVVIATRREVVARRITQMLHTIGRMTKTIVFCTDIDAAHGMRQLLVNLNADLCQQDSRYVMSITGEDKEGKRQLDNFIDPNEPYPCVVTTSELLTTGVDCKTCGLIVIDKEINSMTQFKQILGRGTRLNTDHDKWHFEVLDFRDATRLFSDPDFDGEPIGPGGGDDPQPGGGGNGGGNGGKGGGGGVSEPPKKFYIMGENISIDRETVSYLGKDGKLVSENVIDYTRNSLRSKFASLGDFIKEWSAADRKKAIVDELKDGEVLIDAVRQQNPALADADIFDIICHVAFDQPTLTRRERANKVVKRDYLNKYQGEARRVMEALLDKYADNGILELEKMEVLKLSPFNQIGSPVAITNLFGGKDGYRDALRQIEDLLYRQ
jgi:type I restriction enzyme R subunit